ncbi:Clp protease ClpB [Desulfobulbus sp. Tol-SR]|nr:Clp protease ClpB [Desulfobulbus sp. Tol-SR]
MPLVDTALAWRDNLGTIGARSGFCRSNYRAIPGLYGVGQPGPDSPVLVTANYKLSFDALRRQLPGIDAWILVVDTRGINVWCAAGKKTFSTAEVAYQVKISRLAEIVRHRQLILPQLAAVGVAAGRLRKACGFDGVFGPIRAQDLPAYLHRGRQADETMRTVTFGAGERAVLIPVEICLLWKPFLAATVVLVLISGIGPDIYSLSAAGVRGIQAITASLLAVLAGAVLTPLLLPWIPGRQFWLKGALVGGLTAMAALLPTTWAADLPAATALVLWAASVASYLAMNFTGSTPYTSLSGVGLEMRRGLVFQLGGTTLALGLWIWSAFA